MPVWPYWINPYPPYGPWWQGPTGGTTLTSGTHQTSTQMPDGYTIAINNTPRMLA